MPEKRFNANGVVGVMIWKRALLGANKPRVPCIRLYEPRDPETGRVKMKPDGSSPDFKDYVLRDMIDPTIKFLDDAFEFVETDDGECYVDYSLRTLGEEPAPDGFC